MTAAGDLRYRIKLEMQVAEPSLYGTVKRWVTQFETRAKMKWLIGNETIVAQRLTGVQPVVISVRHNSQTVQIQTSWRVTEMESKKVFNVRSVTYDEKRAFIDLLCTHGGAI
jgi:SPP1 family predicted phage head-tail adaptor